MTKAELMAKWNENKVFFVILIAILVVTSLWIIPAVRKVVKPRIARAYGSVRRRYSSWRRK